MTEAEAEVVVVGAGPAGLVTAIACAARGLTVQVVDRRSAPIDKACGEGLMPDAVAILTRLGVVLPRHRAITGIRYIDGDHRVDGRFPDRPGAGVRRPELHTALLERACDLGVEVWERVRVVGLTSSGSSDRDPTWQLEFESGVESPPWIVAADGLHSPLRRWSGLAAPDRRHWPRRFGIRRHARMCPWTNLVEVHWSDAGEAYVTPVADDQVGVAVLWSRPRQRPSGDNLTGVSGSAPTFERLVRSFPALFDRIAGADYVSPPMAAGPLRQRTRAVTRGNLALVGDAAGYLDAITGEGMALAFHQAIDLADCIAAGDLAPYPGMQHRQRRVPDLFTEATLAMSRHPGLRVRALGALASEPRLFDRILAVHGDNAPLWSLASLPLARGAAHLVVGR